MTSEKYTVRLPAFEGPLDILLALIERRQLEVTSISLVLVADQFLDYVRTIEQVDVATLAQFVSVSARLLLLKSRALLPVPPRSQADTDEVDAESLVQQLREYRRFKHVAGWLRERDEQQMRSYMRPPLAAEIRARSGSPARNVEAVSVLLIAFQRCLQPSRTQPELPEPVEPQLVTLGERISALEMLVATNIETSLSVALAQTTSRQGQVVTFLALLELIKRNRVEVTQGGIFGEVYIRSAAVQVEADTPFHHQQNILSKD